jgi:hypothetical protein
MQAAAPDVSADGGRKTRVFKWPCQPDDLLLSIVVVDLMHNSLRGLCVNFFRSFVVRGPRGMVLLL